MKSLFYRLKQNQLKYNELQILLIAIASPPFPESIGNVEVEGTVSVICGYYDLGGRRLADKQRGVNIVRYSDGTSRKIMVK